MNRLPEIEIMPLGKDVGLAGLLQLFRNVCHSEVGSSWQVENLHQREVLMERARDYFISCSDRIRD